MNAGRTGAGPQIGNFQAAYTAAWPFPNYPDQPIPGLVAVGGAFNNVAAEIIGYLEFDNPGYYRFGINGDDGWSIQIATNFSSSAQVLFSVDRGAGAQDIPFSFIIPKPGLYPVRLTYYQGGGGGNVEFFSYDDNGVKIPINDSNNPKAIKAYYQVNTGGTTPTPTISVNRSGTSVHITFTGRLQKATALGSPTVWVDVPNATSPVDIAPSAAQGYWRAVNP